MTKSLRTRGEPRIRVVMLPKDTNALGNIFGGVILSHLDLAAAGHATGVAPHRYVTKIIHEVDFIAPVLVGDTVSFYTETVSVGRTSIRVRVLVEAERGIGRRERLKVTEADIVMVAVNPRGRPTPINPARKGRSSRR